MLESKVYTPEMLIARTYAMKVIIKRRFNMPKRMADILQGRNFTDTLDPSIIERAIPGCH
jgi:hypothetical protein